MDFTPSGRERGFRDRAAASSPGGSGGAPPLRYGRYPRTAARLGGIDLAAHGLPTLDEAVARYCAADLHWYFADNLFRLMAIVRGIERLIDGNAANAQAARGKARRAGASG